MHIRVKPQITTYYALQVYLVVDELDILWVYKLMIQP